MIEDPTSVEIIPFEGPSDLATVTASSPALFLPEPKASERFWEFFTAHIRNKNTRRAYYKAAARFSEWCESRNMYDLKLVKPTQRCGIHRGVTTGSFQANRQTTLGRATNAV